MLVECSDVGLCVIVLISDKGDTSEKAANQGPQFTSGVIMKIMDSKPLPGRKFIKVKQLIVITVACKWVTPSWFKKWKLITESEHRACSSSSCVFNFKDSLGKISPVAYVDFLEGDSEGHIRFETPEGAKAIFDVRTKLQKEHSWTLEILSGMNCFCLMTPVCLPVPWIHVSVCDLCLQWAGAGRVRLSWHGAVHYWWQWK